MTQAQEKAKRDREYRRKHRLRYIAHSAAWKARNPDWWKGRKMVQLLTSALINGNAKSKVFTDAGMTMDEWSGAWVGSTGYSMAYAGQLLSNGSKIYPVKSWREFDLKDREQVKQFLAPENFKLVSK